MMWVSHRSSCRPGADRSASDSWWKERRKVMSTGGPVSSRERQIEELLVDKLVGLKYAYRQDIRDRASLEANFRQKFEALNRVSLTDGEFQRLLDEIVTPDVYEAAQALRNRETFIRDD